LTTGLPIHYNPHKKEIAMIPLSFVKEIITAKLISPSGEAVEKTSKSALIPLPGAPVGLH
jgi:hypothetical protein